MGPYEIKGLNAALLCCHGGRAEHKDWFFEEYYSSLLKSFIPTFKDRYRSVSSNSDITDLNRQLETITDYVVTVAEKINTIDYPGGGYIPERKYTIPGYRLGFIKFVELCKTPGIDDNVVLIIPIFDISDFSVNDRIDLVELSNRRINAYCNDPQYAKLFKLLKPYYVQGLDQYKTARYIIPTYHAMKLMFLNRRYEPYFN